MDITFWVIQAVLLTPVLFLAASVGMEQQPGRPPRIGGPPRLGDGPIEPRRVRRSSSSSTVAAALAGLGQFTAEQQARLVILRSFVQEARMGRGALSDDMIADTPDSQPTENGSRPPRRFQLRQRDLLLGAGVLLLMLGIVGIVRTNMAIDELQATTTSRVEDLSPAARFLPGALVSPAKYLSAVNGSVSGGSGVDPLYSVNVMWLKQAMDRWEAMAGIGLSLLLLVNAMRASEDSEGSVAFDVAPFVLVAAVLFAALSFFELP